MSISEFEAQNVIWSYHLTTKVDNSPGNLWQNADGSFTLNVHNRKDYSENHTNVFQEAYLLRLTNEGGFDGSIYMNNCRNRTSFMPYKNYYFTHGNNCLAGQNKWKYDYRLFHKNGKLIRIGKSQKKYGQVIHFDPKKTTIFQKDNGYFKYNKLMIGELNEYFNINYDSISLKPLQIEGHGMIFKTRPLQIKKSHFAIGVGYGLPGKYVKSTMVSQYGGFFIFNKKKILWKYVPKKKNYYIKELGMVKNKIVALLSNVNRRVKQVKIFSKKGILVGEFNITLEGRDRIFDMKCQGDEILFLTSKSVLRYGIDGNIIDKIIFPKMSKVHQLLLCDDKAVLVSGVKEKKTFICKIGFNEKEELETEVDTRYKPSILYSSVEPEIKKVTSLSVFPNPTSDKLFFNVVSELEISQIQRCLIKVFTTDGKEVIERKVDVNEIELDVSNLPTATYYYQVLLDNSEFFSGQFIKI